MSNQNLGLQMNHLLNSPLKNSFWLIYVGHDVCLLKLALMCEVVVSTGQESDVSSFMVDPFDKNVKAVH